MDDATGIPIPKIGTAIRMKAPVLVANLLTSIAWQTLNAIYTGYTSCPLVAGYEKLVLAEFDWDNNPMETFPFDQSKERWNMYRLQKNTLPWLYWNMILTGNA